MRHGKIKGKLGKHPVHRDAMIKNMVTSLITHERIVTTVPKAKELRKYADHVIRWGKSGGQHDFRKATVFIKTQEAIDKLFLTLGPRYKDRMGGYTRMWKLQNRYGDNATQAVIEYVDNPLEAYKEKHPKMASVLPAMRKAYKEKKLAEVQKEKETVAEVAAVTKEESKKSINDLD